MTYNQFMLMEYARTHKVITKKEAVQLIGGKYFCNADKHVGDVLSRMVKSGLLKRIKNGVFELGDGIKKNTVPQNQLNLF